MPLEKFLRREIRSRPFIADRFDVPHLNVFITMRSVIRPRHAACACFAPVAPHLHPLGSNHLLHSKPADLIAIAQGKFHLRAPHDTRNELVEDALRI